MVMPWIFFTIVYFSPAFSDIETNSPFRRILKHVWSIEIRHPSDDRFPLNRINLNVYQSPSHFFVYTLLNLAYFIITVSYCILFTFLSFILVYPLHMTLRSARSLCSCFLSNWLIIQLCIKVWIAFVSLSNRKQHRHNCFRVFVVLLNSYLREISRIHAC